MSTAEFTTMITEIESKTDFDVLSCDRFYIDIINRFESDGSVETIDIYNKSTQEIINKLKK